MIHMLMEMSRQAAQRRASREPAPRPSTARQDSPVLLRIAGVAVVLATGLVFWLF